MTNHEDLASGYGIILVKRDGKARPTDNTTKQDCYDILFKMLKEKEDNEVRPTGKWIISDDEVRCSVCNEEALPTPFTIDYWALSNYCPNCGARMEDDEE